MKAKFFILTLIIGSIVLTSRKAEAQQQLKHEKGSYVDSLNRYYMQAKLPIYIYISNSPNAQSPTGLSTSDDNKTVNQRVPIYMDGDGKHHIKHFDAIDNKAETFVVYADGKAPVTQSTFANCPVYQGKTQLFYGKGLVVPLLSKDEMVGVKKTYKSINLQEYTEYSQPTEFTTEGEINFKYYAVDHVGNVENPIEKKFVIDLSSPVTHHVLKALYQRNNISNASIMTLEVSDNLSGVAKTFFHFDENEDILWDGKNINFSLLKEGDHTLYYHSVDNVQNKETEQKFEFFYDKSAPIVATDILGDRFIVNDQIYFSGRSKLKITAVDNKAGILSTKYAIDDLNFIPYVDPFYLPNKPGIHIIRYYSEDSLSNKSIDDKSQYQQYLHRIGKVYVDLTGPALSHKYSGNTITTRDTVFINAQTKIELSYSDAESGIQKLNYSLDNGSQELPYKEPFTLENEGYHKVEIIGYDNVNNRNVKSFFFIVDKSGPEISYKFSVKPIGSKDGLDIYPPFAVLFLAPTDNLTGINLIKYTLNTDIEKDYQRNITNFKKGQINILKMRVTDQLGNETKQEIKFNINDK